MDSQPSLLNMETASMRIRASYKSSSSGLEFLIYVVCRGLHIEHSVRNVSHRLVVDKLFKDCDILCLQETWLAKQDLGVLNGINSVFHGVGESITDLNKLIRGCISGEGGGW